MGLIVISFLIYFFRRFFFKISILQCNHVYKKMIVNKKTTKNIYKYIKKLYYIENYIYRHG